MSCVDKEESKITKTTKVQTVDIWAAIDALDAVPSTHAIDWYKRLVEAADASTLLMAAENGWVTRQ